MEMTLTRTKDNIIMGRNEHLDVAAISNRSKLGIQKISSGASRKNSTKTFTKYLDTYSTKNAKPKNAL